MSWVALLAVVLVGQEIQILEDACSFKIGKYDKHEQTIVSINVINII